MRFPSLFARETAIVFLRKIPPLVIVPALFLAIFLGLFVTVEYKKLANDAEIKAVVNAPLSAATQRLQEAVSELESAVDLFDADRDHAPDRAADIARRYETVLQEAAVLRSLFLQEALNSKEYVSQNDAFQKAREQIDSLESILPKAGASSFSEQSWLEVRAETDKLIRLVRDLNLAMGDAHREEANSLIEQIGRYEEQRAVLSVLVLLSAIALILSLFVSVKKYRDNAERARAAERYNALFAAALQSTRVGVLIRDMRQMGHPVVFVNTAFTRMTGYAIQDIVTDSSEFLFGWNTDPGAIVAFRRALSLQETATFDLLVYRKDGSPFWSEWHLSPVLDGAGKLTHFVSLFTDTTAFRQAQEELIQAKQLAQNASAIKTNFLAMMSHEIRTPINGILGVLKLVEETPLDDDQRHLIDIARTSSNALHGIINDILDFAKIEAGKVEIVEDVFSLSDIIDNVVGLFQTVAAEKGIELQLDLQDNLPTRYISDSGRIRQVLLNLLSNAIKFTDQGFVRLRVLSLMSQDVEGKPGVLLRFEVQDTGIGIGPEDQEKLFKEFSQIERSFTRRFGGTGLGLAISRRLVELLHGEIGVESQPGKGSKFWFLIPLAVTDEAPAAPERAAAVELPPADPNRLYHILLVEDNDTNRLVARRYLEKAGFLVEEATNGLEAIEKAKIAAFDLILMDVSMPEMDGMLATCHIRALGGHNAKLPVIALTAHVMAGDRELCLAAGMNDYLNKPLNFEDLLRTLGRWLHVRVAVPSAAPAARPAAGSPVFPAEGSLGLCDIPDFDPHILARMKDDLGGAVVDQVTKTFLADSLERLTAFESQDRETVMNAAHTLKSCSANCGLLRFSKLMETLEAAASRGDLPRIDSLLAQVGETYRTARARLEQERTHYIA